MSVLEDLIVNTRGNYSDDLRAARNQPPHPKLTDDLRLALAGDPDASDGARELLGKAEKAAKLSDGERIADVAVRGENLSVIVADADGVTSPGFFALKDLGSSSRKALARAAEQGEAPTPAPTRTRRGAVEHGTGDPAKADIPTGVPPNIAELNRDDTLKLLKSPPEGVDPRAVAAYEQSRESPRASVVKEAEKLGLLEPAPAA